MESTGQESQHLPNLDDSILKAQTIPILVYLARILVT